MSAFWISLCVLLLVLGGAAAGMGLRAVLPEHHLSKDSKDIVNLCVGVIATLAALVLGLLIASAKSSFDVKVHETRQIATTLILMDRALLSYGAETDPVRKLLREATAARLAQGLSHRKVLEPSELPEADRERLRQLQASMLTLKPGNDSQRWLQQRALTLSTELAQNGVMLNEQAGSSLPMPFLVILVCWLMVIFGSIGLFAPANQTVRVVMLVCALSTASAIFLILEMDRPFEGWIRISDEPLRNALAVLEL